MHTRKNILLLVCLLFLPLTACQTNDSPSTITPPKTEGSSENQAKKEEDQASTVRDFRFELNNVNIEALKKGEISGFPVQLGDDENRVKKVLGKPDQRKDDGQGQITLSYPNYELSLVDYEGVGVEMKKLKVPVVKAVSFPIQMTKSDIEDVMGKPSDQRALRPNYPELEYQLGRYDLLFLTTQESKVFEGPYDELYFVDPRT